MTGNPTNEKQPLIKGCFHHNEAREIITSLFQSKMQFHSISMLSIRERTGGDTSFHSDRIKSLSLSLQKITALLDEAKKENREVEIECDIQIRLASSSASAE